MFGVIASSTRLSAPSNRGHHNPTPHSYHSEVEHNCQVSNAKSVADKERETFLSYGIFNMVAGKRTAELLHKQHKHEHRNSQPEISHNSLADLFHLRHAHHNTSESPRLQKYGHSHTVDIASRVSVPQRNRKSSDCGRHSPDLVSSRDLVCDSSSRHLHNAKHVNHRHKKMT